MCLDAYDWILIILYSMHSTTNRQYQLKNASVHKHKHYELST